MGYKTKIDWADTTWNPVTGCLHGCAYCYARKIAQRFGGMAPDDQCHELDERNRDSRGKADPYPFGFAPTFHRYRLDEPQKWTEPRTIFVCSMADLFGDWVPDEWIKTVFDACLKAPQHRYLFLTKNPTRYGELFDRRIIPHQSETQNMWFGSTITTTEDTFIFSEDRDRHIFVSIEPILKPFLNLGIRTSKVDWIIVGAETGNRKDKVIPKKEWIDDIILSCQWTNTPVFLKESLRKIMGEDFRQEYPWTTK